MLQGVTLCEHRSYADKSAIAARECAANGYVAAALLTAMYCHFPFCWLHPPRLDPWCSIGATSHDAAQGVGAESARLECVATLRRRLRELQRRKSQEIVAH